MQVVRMLRRGRERVGHFNAVAIADILVDGRQMIAARWFGKRVLARERVFQDETGVSTDMIRRYDRASDGVRCRDAAPAGRYRVCDNPPAHKAVEI
jgi:hypothetical protein